MRLYLDDDTANLLLVNRDMQPPHIVRAIRNLLTAGVPVADQLIVLNHWR